MSASPEFYKPAPVFSPCSSPLLLHGDAVAAAADQGTAWEEQCCRTPKGAGTGLGPAAGTCPPAPRKPRAPAAPCRKRLFEVEVFSLRLEELERLSWRPQPQPQRTPPPDKKTAKRRRVAPPPPPPQPEPSKS